MKQKKIDVTEVKCASISTSFSGKDDNYVELTEWANGEGVGLFIDRDEKHIDLTFEELEAVVQMAKKVWDIK